MYWIELPSGKFVNLAQVSSVSISETMLHLTGADGSSLMTIDSKNKYSHVEDRQAIIDVLRKLATQNG